MCALKHTQETERLRVPHFPHCKALSDITNYNLIQFTHE